MLSFFLSPKLKVYCSPGYLKIEGPIGHFITNVSNLHFNLVNTSEGVRIFITKDTTNGSIEIATTISRLYQLLQGISRGYRCGLRIVGVGFRATIHAITSQREYNTQIKNIKGYLCKRRKYSNREKIDILGRKIGYSYESVYPSSQYKHASIRTSRMDSRSKGTLIYLQSNSFEHVNKIASEIRSFRVPDIYKGKGIYYQNETIKLKKGKRQGLSLWMGSINKYTPRYTISIKTKSKVWPNKNSYFRGFYSLRSHRVKRVGLFIRFFLVANRIKWVVLRRSFKPVTKIAGSQSVPVGGKTAFGRPFKRRYSHLFYRKQQLRFFHGKVQERTFCHSFQKHYISVSKHTRIFFNSIESRLDIYFFRIRVFPTIFACHQLIFHQGVEVNEGVERAPSFVVRVGDMISISSIMWMNVYTKLLNSVYNRRWGLFIMRRRLYYHFQEYIFFSSIQTMYSNTTHIEKSWPWGITHINLPEWFKDKVNYDAMDGLDSFSVIKEETPVSFESEKKIRSNYIDQSIIIYNILSYQNERKAFFSRIREIKIVIRTKRVTSVFRFFKEKQDIYQKFVFAVKIRQSFIPRIVDSYKEDFLTERESIYYLLSNRENFTRFYWKHIKNQIRYQKYPRLKAVHFYTPSNIQMDFRTLCSIKIESPTLKKIHYPFQISLPKIYSFYRSKGF